MEHNTVCPWPIESWPIEGIPSPLSTDVEEIASYMRVAHAVDALRDRKRSSTDRGE
ncbi:MAG TPA: hypothetical protein VM282_01955 [Acidimicrobiales bacterium]|nr:hypothetical protein [Acidimicrobiales bacterium]